MNVATLVIGLGVFGQAGSAEGRALAYLAREVPTWRLQNGCFSCHHNGDAARALYTARGLGRVVPDAAFARTTAWLTRPDDWDHNGGEGPFSDKQLAHLQFAAALSEAVRVGVVTDLRPLRRAAERLVEDQAADGSWSIEGGDLLGTPATWGRALATAQGRWVLKTAAEARFDEPISRAGRWLARLEVRRVPDAAAVVLGLEPGEAPEARIRALALLRNAVGPDGGWGPYPAHPPEPFDTALALLALIPFEKEPGIRALVRNGRAYLAAEQLEDGHWPETTRPPGAESLAQRLSTTGWATIALLRTAGLDD